MACGVAAVDSLVANVVVVVVMDSLPSTFALKWTLEAFDGRAIGSCVSSDSTVSRCWSVAVLLGEPARDDWREDVVVVMCVVCGRNPLPRNGDSRPPALAGPPGLGARDWPILNSLMMANDDFLCCRGWFILFVGSDEYE